MVKATCKLVFALTAFYLAYLTAGALVLGRLELTAESTGREDVRRIMTDFTKSHTGVSERELQEFLGDIMMAGRKTIPLVATEESQWQFGNAFLFCTTLLTTIGYGNLAPATSGGRLFCLAYLSFGLPLTCVLWAVYVDWFLRILNMCLMPRFHVLFLLTAVLALILGPSAAFSLLQPGWSYLDAVYYSVISLTTIGLGDLVAGDDIVAAELSAGVYRVLLSLYLLLGVALMMTLLSRAKLDLDPPEGPEDKLPLSQHHSGSYYGS